MTAGPWRPIHLHSYTTHIQDFRVSSKVDSELAVDVDVSLSLDGPTSGSAVSVFLLDPFGNKIQKSDKPLDGRDTSAHFHLNKGDVELWYPVGYGKQPIYSVRVEVKDQVLYSSFASVKRRCRHRGRLSFLGTLLARSNCGHPNGEGWIPSRARRPRKACGPRGAHVPFRDQQR